MFKSVTSVAVRHQRLANRVAFVAAIGLAATVGAGAGLEVIAPNLMFAAFAMFLSVAMLGWGTTLIASWFGPPSRQRVGFLAFYARAERAYVGFFLVLWFAVALFLVIAAVVSLVTNHLPF
jgi:hypothetical protein